jgi:predicted 3-demethylubiquinone-9 3-methyltransferase (glyoxalase superfamily)
MRGLFASTEGIIMTMITPFLMFEGQAEAAMTFYVSLFKDSEVTSITRYGPEGSGAEGTVMRASFMLCGQRVMCIDSPVKHAFGFTPAISMFVDCETPAEVEALYIKLAEGGQTLMPLNAYPFSRKFAWVNDRFGVSWQLNLPD